MLEGTSIQLSDVIVTGQYEAGSARNSVYKVRSIDQERIRALGAVHLKQVLQQELNIRTSYDPALGESSMSLQGIGGQNIRILMDGVPLAGREGSNVDLNQINLNNIERIEIVEGPMAIQFGANALAGVINLITKKGGTGKDWNIRLDLQEESVGKAYGLQEGIHNQSLLAGVQLTSKLYAQAGLTRHFFGGHKGSRTDRTFEWHPKLQWAANGLLRYSTRKQHIHYMADLLEEEITVRGKQEFNETYAFDNRFLTHRFSQQLVGEGTLFQNHRFTSQAGWTHFRRVNEAFRNDLNTRFRTMLNLDDPQREITFDTYTLRGTLTRVKQNRWINYEAGFDINSETRGGGRIEGGRREMRDYAFFTSLEIHLLKRIKIKPGVRMAYNTQFAAPPVVPGVHAKWRLGDRTDFRAGYAMGYRAPGLRELYFNFFDANHSIRGNSNLLAETSDNFSGGLSHVFYSTQKTEWKAEAQVFHNVIQNRIGFGTDPADARVLTFVNIDQYRTEGISGTTSVRVGTWQASGGVAYIGVSNSLTGVASALNNKMLYSPEVQASLSYLHPATKLRFTGFYKYTGKAPFLEIQPDGTAAIRRAGDWHMSDITATYSVLKDHIQFTGGVRNLFNITQVAAGILNPGIHSAGPNMMISYGRSVFLRMTIQFH
jgi:outer membrane receptor for ferrienterochelin and colicins